MHPEAIFERLREKYPDQLAHTSILSAEGRAGLILDHGDGTLSKVLYRPTDNDEQNSLRENLQTEVNCLRYFRENPSVDMELPTLIGEAIVIDKDPDIFAMYRMTAIQGQPAEWKYSQPPQFKTETEFNDYFVNAGIVLAKFHQAIESIPDIAGDEEQPGSEISTLSSVDASLNAQLQKADRYLQQYKEPVIGHGDFHGGNLMQDEKGNINGVIDFDLVHKWNNKMMDFLNVPPAGLKSFIRGYEQQSGENIDPAMILLTEISLQVDQAKSSPKNSPEYTKAIESVKRYLAKAAPYLEEGMQTALDPQEMKGRERAPITQFMP